MGDQAELHNQLVEPILASIVRPVLESGGTANDAMVLTESVLVGVAAICIKLGNDEQVLDVMFARAKTRLAELRRKNIATQGRG